MTPAEKQVELDKRATAYAAEKKELLTKYELAETAVIDQSKFPYGIIPTIAYMDQKNYDPNPENQEQMDQNQTSEEASAAEDAQKDSENSPEMTEEATDTESTPE